MRLRKAVGMQLTLPLKLKVFEGCMNGRIVCGQVRTLTSAHRLRVVECLESGYCALGGLSIGGSVAAAFV